MKVINLMTFELSKSFVFILSHLNSVKSDATQITLNGCVCTNWKLDKTCEIAVKEV